VKLAEDGADCTSVPHEKNENAHRFFKGDVRWALIAGGGTRSEAGRDPPPPKGGRTVHPEVIGPWQRAHPRGGAGPGRAERKFLFVRPAEPAQLSQTILIRGGRLGGPMARVGSGRRRPNWDPCRVPDGHTQL